MYDVRKCNSDVTKMYSLSDIFIYFLDLKIISVKTTKQLFHNLKPFYYHKAILYYYEAFYSVGQKLNYMSNELYALLLHGCE